ncbi:caspase family protein [Desmonostoc muscorum CCALA 125]|nr:caspase family protein [Desmonostoc muscorum CCALA 125]
MVKVALLIGVSEYEPGLNPLPGAVRDVEAMQQVLLHPEMGGFAKTDIMVLKNPQRQDMEEAIENLFDHRQKDDLLLLFFSGHGIKDDTGRLFLATRTTRKTPRGDLIRSSAVSSGFIHESMSRSRSKRQVVILDSCFSGAFAEGLSAKDDGTVNIREQLGGEGRAVLTSSSSTQYSFEQQGSDLSIYTRYLIEGITTGAADLDEDGVVSIDELHDYASRKVREIQPTMKPEIYTSREGFKIRLTKVPQGDPKQKYRKEVARYSNRGEVTFVGRKILDALRSRLGLSEIEATAIEDEMLAVTRQKFQEKLQRYERDFSEALQQQVALSEDELNTLRLNLQQILGLRNEDTMPIEMRVTTRIEAYKRHLQVYKQSLVKAMRREYPLSQSTRHQLQQMQQEWQLKYEDLAAIENSLIAEVEAYRQKLQQFEQAFTTAVQQEYPLSEAKHNQLWQQQQLLGLKAEDIHPITARITAEIEAYREKLQQFEQVLTQAIEHEYPFTEEIREELRRYQHILEIRDEEVVRIEEKVVRQRNTNQPQIQQSNTYEAPVVQSHSIDIDAFLEEVKADELPTQFLSRQVIQVIPETEPVKTPKLPLRWIVSVIFVVATGAVGLFVKQLQSESGQSQVASTPTPTQSPSVAVTQPPRTLANLSAGWVIQTTKEIPLADNQPLPAKSFLQVINTEPNPKPASGDFSVRMRVCTNKPTPTPAPSPAKLVSIQFQQLYGYGVSVLSSDAPSPCKPIIQPPVSQPPDTSPT